MRSINDTIRETARELLAAGTVDVVIGYERGSVPLRATPCFIRNAQDVERLVWDATCENNLAKFLKDIKGKKAVIAKGCDSRAIAMLVNEGQLVRDELYIIGVPCSGLVDRKKIEADMGEEVLSAFIQAGTILVNGIEQNKSFPLSEVLDKTCMHCRYPNPVIFDIMLGEKVERPLRTIEEDYADVLEMENQSTGEREAYFKAEMAKCIRCYACRNACPMCYCPECFVDCNSPQWLTGGVNSAENLFFHTGRLMHLAGRCVACGACTRACPQNVDILSLKRKVNKDVLSYYQHEAGLSETSQPALNEYTTVDPQPFLVKE